MIYHEAFMTSLSSTDVQNHVHILKLNTIFFLKLYVLNLS